VNDAKYIGLDVHQATISVVVLDSTGHLVMESIIETKATTILQLIQGLRGNLQATFEEGTCAAWLHDLLQPHVTNVAVCDPRKNALLKAGNKNDRIDARKLADLLRSGLLSPVYHGENGVRTLKELARSYLALTRDATRVMNRLKALYRGWAIPCAGQKVYTLRYRHQWLAKITEAGVRRRAEFYYQQLDALQTLRQQVRRDLLVESRKHSAMQWLRQIPSGLSEGGPESCRAVESLGDSLGFNQASNEKPVSSAMLARYDSKPGQECALVGSLEKRDVRSCPLHLTRRRYTDRGCPTQSAPGS
jgi:transposase